MKIVTYSRSVGQLTAGEVMTQTHTIEPELLVSQLIDQVLPLRLLTIRDQSLALP